MYNALKPALRVLITYRSYCWLTIKPLYHINNYNKTTKCTYLMCKCMAVFKNINK